MKIQTRVKHTMVATIKALSVCTLVQAGLRALRKKQQVVFLIILTSYWFKDSHC